MNSQTNDAHLAHLMDSHLVNKDTNLDSPLIVFISPLNHDNQEHLDGALQKSNNFRQPFIYLFNFHYNNVIEEK